MGPESGGLAVAFGPPGVLILPVGNDGKVFTNEAVSAVGVSDTFTAYAGRAYKHLH